MNEVDNSNVKRIAISGGKGGTGKSTVSTSLADIYARRKRVILVDADVECPNDHLLLSVDRKEYSEVSQLIPKWDFDRCTKCGICADVCKQDAIVFVEGRYPAFVQDLCTGCQACIVSCPTRAISKSTKQIGTVYTGEGFGIYLVSGELKLGELASGEVVAEVRKITEEINRDVDADVIMIDSPAGVGCPVIASMTGTDYIVAVTEPTPSALHDLKRVLYLANHFNIECGIVINKFDLKGGFHSEIEKFARENNIPIIGKIPFRSDFMDALLKMKPVVEQNPEYVPLFQGIIDKVEEAIST